MHLGKILVPLALLLAACAPAILPTARTVEPAQRVGLFEGQLKVQLHTGRSAQALPALWNQAELRVESGALKAVQSSGVLASNTSTIQHDFFLPPGPATVSASLWESGELVATGSATTSVVPGMNALGIMMQTAIGTITTLAGQMASGSNDGFGGAASFNSPKGLALDASGSLYVADSGNHRIRRVAPSGEVTTLAGWGPGFLDGSGWVATASGSAMFNDPQGLVVDPLNQVLYVADTGNHLIRRIFLGADPATNSFVTSVAGVVGSAALLDGTGNGARFNLPLGLALVPASASLYVADSGNHCIRKIDLNTYAVTTYAGDGLGAFGFVDGPSNTARFNSPGAVAVDDWGNVYVADSGNHRIRKISTSGVVSTLAGTGTQAFTDGSAAVAQFGYPSGLWWHADAASGSLVIADTLNHRIRQIDLAREATDSAYVKTMVGMTNGFADGTETTARFYSPHGVIFEGLHKIFVADTVNQRIRLGIGPGAGATVQSIRVGE